MRVLGLVSDFLMPPFSCAELIWFTAGIWILIGETFPTRSRAKQGALSTASNWLWVRFQTSVNIPRAFTELLRLELPPGILHPFHHFRDRVPIRVRLCIV